MLPATPGSSADRAKRLVATRPSGPEPTVTAFENAERGVRAIGSEVARLARAGVGLDEVAVLVRTNAQIPPFEEALAAAGIAYQVRGELFFRRTEVLRAIGVLRSRTGRPAGGWSPPLRRSGSSGSGSAATRSPTARRHVSATPAWSPCSGSPSGSRPARPRRPRGRGRPAWPSSWRRWAGGAPTGPRAPGAG